MADQAIRVCKACGGEKSDTDFYASQRYKCKECVKEAARSNRAANQEHYRIYERSRSQRPDRVSMRLAYQQTDAFRESHNKASRKWSEQHPNRKSAQTAVGNALRDGTLKREPCFECGSTLVEGHHPDYSAPLSVVWLCRQHHRQLHDEHEIFLRSTQTFC